MRRIALCIPISVVSAAVQLVGIDLWVQYSPTTGGPLGILAQVYAMVAILLAAMNVALFYACVDREDPFQWVVIRHDLMLALFLLPALFSYVLIVPGLGGRVIVKVWKDLCPSNRVI